MRLFLKVVVVKGRISTVYNRRQNGGKKFFMFERSEFEKFPILSAGCGARGGPQGAANLFGTFSVCRKSSLFLKQFGGAVKNPVTVRDGHPVIGNGNAFGFQLF